MFDGGIVSTRCGWLADAAARRRVSRCTRACDGHDTQLDAVGVGREDVDDATSHVAHGRRRRAACRLTDRRVHTAGASLRRRRQRQRVGAGLR